MVTAESALRLTPRSASDLFLECGSLAELVDLDRNGLDMLYQFGCQLVDQGDLGPAEKLFGALVALDPHVFEYALALGLCRQAQGAHEEALVCFAQAGSVRITDPRPPYHAALSYRKIGRPEKARQAYEAVLRWSYAKPEYAPLEQSASMALAELDSPISSTP